MDSFAVGFSDLKSSINKNFYQMPLTVVKRSRLLQEKHELRVITKPIPVAAQSKAWVCGRSLAGTAGSNPAGGMDICPL